MDVNTKKRRARHTETVPQPPMNPHQYRCLDADYEAAMRAAEAREENLATEVRKFVIKYGKPYKKKGDKR